MTRALGARGNSIDAPTERIHAPRALLAEIEAQAVAAYPCECCGLLVGQPHGAGALVLTAIAASANVTAHSPRDSFEVDPGLRFRLMRELRGTAAGIVGHYHSHPDRPALPSTRDATAACEPELVWLIVSVTADGAGPPAAFRFDARGRTFHPLAIIEDA